MLGAVEMTFRRFDKPVRTDLPDLEAADANRAASASGPVLVPVNVQ
jgi:hypothetical protein